jgi:eukaryotic-like serine/threonine-protein kinase
MTAAADRHLLLGLIGLQNGLINQGQLVAAFHAWTLAKSRSLADHLQARGDLTGARRALLEALADVHLEAHGGDVEKSLAAVSVGRSTRESLAGLGDPGIEATLAHVGSTVGAYDDDADSTPNYSVGTATSDGQRFRILRPHARGGLGAVFVALDSELHREVALKQILDHHADDPNSRQRFLLEAEVTGGLEHPGIVPVYGLGTYEDGRPYYAMRFIRGDSLKEAINRFHADDSLKQDPGRRSLELRKLLRRFTDVCNAIDYAHSRGVLHRDIKPGNIIVGKHGETLVVDWGLAKATGRAEPGTEERMLVPSSTSGSAETLPGSALGTPPYMSPEQASGDTERLGPLSDVYSLGSTLFCLLTGTPPYDGNDVGEVLLKVQRGEFAYPRQLDPSIDKALEAVCKKAMAINPADRYASCRALADDVDRWMADEPVSAWAEPRVRKLTRWLSRHRTGVTGAGAAVLAGVVGLSAVLAVQTRANAQLSASLYRETAANRALAESNDELTRAKTAVQARYDLAVEAIKIFHTGVSKDFLLKQSQFKELRDRLLKSAADFYGKLAALLGRETDFASRRALAQSNFELADLMRTLGRFDDALTAHRAVLAAREALVAEPGADVAATVDAGRSVTAVAGLLRKMDDALAAYRRAVSLLEGPAGADPKARAALADCRSRMGSLLSQTGRHADALAAYQLARVDQEALAAAPGASNDARLDLALTIIRIGNELSATGKPSQAETEYRRALAIHQKLVDENPAVTEFRASLCVSHMGLGNVLSSTGRSSEAESEYRQALAIQQKVADENPAVMELRGNLAANRYNLGLQLSTSGKQSLAEVEYHEALILYEKLVHDNPAVSGYKSMLAATHHNLGHLFSTAGKLAEAEAEFRKAMPIQQKLVSDNPAITRSREFLANHHFSLGSVMAETGRRSEAEAEIREALAIRQKLAEDNPAITSFRNSLADGHLQFGYLLWAAGKPANAEAEQRRALALFEKLAHDEPKVPDYRDSVASALTNLGDAVRSLGRPAEAREGYERAIAIRQRLFEENLETPTYRSHLAWSLRRRGLARRDLGDAAGAASDARRSLALYEGLSSRSAAEWFETACCYSVLWSLIAREGVGTSSPGRENEPAKVKKMLRQAAAMGYRDTRVFRTETALDPLRARQDFQELMMDLVMPTDPFAHTN